MSAIMNSTIKRMGFGILSCLLLPTHAGLAQNQLPEPFAYPTQNQTPEQQQKDQRACSQWATQQTGVKIRLDRRPRQPLNRLNREPICGEPEEMPQLERSVGRSAEMPDKEPRSVRESER